MHEKRLRDRHADNDKSKSPTLLQASVQETCMGLGTKPLSLACNLHRKRIVPSYSLASAGWRTEKIDVLITESRCCSLYDMILLPYKLPTVSQLP